MPKSPIDSIKEFVDSKASFCFNSGAGSGKTYNLVKTIEYISDKYGDKLVKANQKIMVITFTNAATNEIIYRIGKSRICDISTIHTRLWDIIKKFQSDLLKLHLQKINITIADIEETLKDNPYSNDSLLKNEIEKNKDFIDEFYKNTSLGAQDFKSRFLKYTTNQQIPVVNDFKKFVSKKNKQKKLLEAKTGIEQKGKKYKRVEYDPFDNSDKLYKMKFSHDTLIEYASKLIAQNKTIRKIIVDKYPYTLIDEYQDTAAEVINIFKVLMPKMMVGFYGDNCQNIYGSGVGDKLFEFLPHLNRIDNEYNRRSVSRIVALGNVIRSDELFKQKALSSDEGSVEFFYSKTENEQIINSFIEKTKADFHDSKVSFFLLKNEQVANKSGFGNFFSTINSTAYYKNNYDQIATEILSDDETKLGKIPHNLYQMFRLRNLILNEKKTISEYIPSAVYKKMNLYKVSELISMLKTACQCNTLGELIANLSSLYNLNNDAKAVLEDNISDCALSSFDDYKGYLFDCLYGYIPDDQITEAQRNIETILSITISEISKWYNYILRISDGTANYYTLHGTKGLEFDNVAVIITNNFNRKKDYYHTFFNEIGCTQKSDDFVMKKNLLYVSMTRAKKNLRVLYLDSDFDSISKNFSSIFENAKEYTID